MTTAGAAPESDRYRRAFALHQQARLPEARALYEQILQDRPDHFGALLLLGLMELQTDNPHRAVELTARAMLLDPRNADACNYHGSALLELQRFEDAIASYERSIALNPAHPLAHNNRGIALSGLNRYSDAVDSFDRAIARTRDRRS